MVVRKKQPAKSVVLERIALFVPSLVGGGAEKVFLHLASGFANEGIQVDLVAAGAFGELLHQVDKRVRVIDLGKKRVLDAIPPLISYLKREKPPVMLCGLRQANVVGLVSKLLVGKDVKVILTEHQTPYDPTVRSLKEKILLWAAKFLYAAADGLVSVSSGLAKELEAFLWGKDFQVQVIHNPIDLDVIEILSHKHPEHPWLDVKTTPVLLAVGRLHANKDYVTLLHALVHINQVRPVRLILLGQGEEYAHLKKVIHDLNLQKSVSMPGFVDNPYAFMRKADVFVLSSRVESFSMAILEALACGTSIVSTNCPSGPVELLEQGKYGRLVPVGDEEQLAEAILETLTHPLPKGLLRTRAQEFALPSIIRQYLLLIDRVLGEP